MLEINIFVAVAAIARHPASRPRSGEDAEFSSTSAVQVFVTICALSACEK